MNSRRVAKLHTSMAMALVVSACTTGPPSASQDAPTPSPSTASGVGAFTPSYAEAPCPEDVLATEIAGIECGYLTVLEDRAKPAGRTIRLFVQRVEPPGGTTTPDPAMGSGGDLGAIPEPGGMSGGAQRIHRTLFELDRRGKGRSEPNLDCPEVRAAGPALAGLRLRDPAHDTTLATAIRACRDRLVGMGIDLSAYGIEANIADLEDLRVAFGISTWNGGGNLNGSRIGFAYAGRNPEAVRTFIVDSPALPTPDLLTIGPEAFDQALDRLVEACTAQPACSRRAPDLAAMIDEAARSLDLEPVTFEVEGTVEAIRAGHPIRVVVDGAALLRFIRAQLGTHGGQTIARIVPTVSAVLDDALAADDPSVLALASDAGACMGLFPACDRMNFGALYSLVCRDILPFTDDARLEAAVANRPAYADLFRPGPFAAACEAWSADPAERGEDADIGRVPTLIFRGWFDPYSTPMSDIESVLGDSPNVHLIEVPNASYNPFGYAECPRTIRNAWIDAPMAPPADLSCLDAIPPLELVDP